METHLAVPQWITMRFSQLNHSVPRFSGELKLDEAQYLERAKWFADPSARFAAGPPKDPRSFPDQIPLKEMAAAVPRVPERDPVTGSLNLRVPSSRSSNDM
jgi:hypothetical protein